MTTRERPRTDRIHEHYGRCDLHAIPCCSICCKHEGQCDYGDCDRETVECLPCFNLGGIVVEERPTCAQHATYGSDGVGYDLRAEAIRADATNARQARRHDQAKRT